MTRSELINLTSEFMRGALADVQTRLNEFMRKNRLSAEAAARTLGISTQDVNKILAGSSDVSLKTYASVLIASGLIFCVQTIEEASRNMPHMRGGARANRPTHQPTRDRFGRFVSQQPPVNVPQAQPQPQVQPRYDDLGRGDLMEIVINNGWEGEIDLRAATKEQIISFLEHKDEEAMAQQEAMPCNGEGEESTTFVQKIADFLEANPEVKQLFSGLMSNGQ